MRNIKNLFFLLLGTLVLSSCADDFVDTSPTTALDADGFISDAATAQAAVNGMYSLFQQSSISGGDHTYLQGLFSDELRHSGSFPSFAEYNSNDIALNNVDNTQYWTNHYQTINAANIIIDALQRIDIDPTLSARFDSQAKAIRAYLYYNLVKVYGGVPLSLTGNLSATAIDQNPLPRSSRAEVFNQILTDVTDALDGITSSSNIFFFNKNSVRVLKAKVEMELGMFTEAEATIEPVLGKFTLASDYADLFTGTANTQEGILAIDFASFDGNGLAFFFLSDGGRFEVAPSNILLGAFTPEDTRTSQILNFEGDDAEEINKYKDPGGGSDDVYIYRYADVLLMKAELAARRDDPEASDYINMVRERAGLAPVTLNSSNVVDLIAQERFLELWAENNDRLFTITRLGIADAVIQAKTGITFIPERNNLWPIPQQEIERNSAISAADQNPGY